MKTARSSWPPSSDPHDVHAGTENGANIKELTPFTVIEHNKIQTGTLAAAATNRTFRPSLPREGTTVLIFATGSGISPIRSLIESGSSANKRSDVRLYYGARNLERMAYQDRFDDWESTGVRIIPVLSQPDDVWKGERGYVQAAFSRARCILNPLSTGAVLCGHKQMTEEITTTLVGDGVLQQKILKNF